MLCNANPSPLMIPTPVNAAEAVIEAFFDETLSQLPQWHIDQNGADGLTVVQKWAWVQFDWQRPPADPGTPALRLRRELDLDCRDYDTLVVSLVVPAGTRVELTADTDTGQQSATTGAQKETKREAVLPLQGARRLRGLTIALYADAARNPGPACGWFNWIGLQHGPTLERYLRQFERFDETWADFLKPPAYEPSFNPVYGLHLTAAELEQARTELAHAGGRAESPLSELAADAQRRAPETMMSEFVNFWNDTRFNRLRDHGKLLLTNGANAAQAAVLWRDQALGRLAARYAMCLAHSTRWDPSFMSWMTGCKWEHRAFVPSLVMYDCALILDLCGEWFTDYGKQVILRRLAEEGHGTNNYNTWWYTYIFWCNQTAWWLPGRMYAYLVLERELPVTWEPHPKPAQSRVVPYTDLCLADLQDNLSKILLPDGGYTEGPGYFTFTARQALISFYYYSRARGIDVRSLVPPALYATAVMAETLVSTADDSQMILICDAQCVPQEGAAFLAWLMPDSHWVTIFRKSIARTGQPLSLLAQNLARDIPERGPQLSPVVNMPTIGQMASHRKLGGEWVKLFLMGNQSGASHTHEDKGSFVLEFAGDTLAKDFAICDYSNPLADMMKHAQRHNMLVPLTSSGARPKPKNPIFADIIPQGEGDATRFHASMDLTAGWEGWFKAWKRTWDSPTPDKLIITDDWAVERGDGVAFHWTTPLPITLESAQRRAIITGRRGRAILTWDEGVEAVCEELPLEEPVWKDVLRERKEAWFVTTLLPEKQPRLTLMQRGTNGRLEVSVKLELI